MAMMVALKTAALSLAVVIGASAAGSGDYAMRIPALTDQPTICAKSEETCERARWSIRRGEFLRGQVEPLTLTWCEPAPECFSARSNCIPGYHGPRPEGICGSAR